MTNINVSVCLPVYKVEKYIERCARSLFEQALWNDIEFIFVDDCSPDRSVEILRKTLEDYPQRKSQVKIICLDKNSGRVAARNRAVAEATGKYVIFCDSDDRVEAGFYADMLQMAEDGDLDVVVAPISMIWSSGRKERFDGACETLDGFFHGYFADTWFCSLWNKLFRRDVLVCASVEFGACEFYGEDLLMVAQLLLGCRSIGFVHDSAYEYFRVPESGTVSAGDSVRNVYQLIEVDRILEVKLPEKYHDCLVYFRHVCCIKALRSGKFSREEFESLWPDCRTWQSLVTDRKLARYKAVLIFICSRNYWLGSLAFRALLATQRTVRRLRNGTA